MRPHRWPPDAVLDKVVDKATNAVKAFVDDDNTMASPRPDVTTRHKREQAAEAAVVAVAARRATLRRHRAVHAR